MSKSGILKTSLGIGSLVGGCCLIATPSIISSVQGGGEYYGGNTLGLSDRSSSTGSELISNMEFESMGSKLEMEGKSKQDSNMQSLPGKERFKDMVVSNHEEKGEVKGKDFAKCSSSERSKIMSCVYLGLSEGNKEYKLKASFDDDEQKGRLYLFSKEKDDVKFYNFDKGENYESGKFEKLSISISQEDSGWQNLGNKSPFVYPTSK